MWVFIFLFFLAMFLFTANFRILEVWSSHVSKEYLQKCIKLPEMSNSLIYVYFFIYRLFTFALICISCNNNETRAYLKHQADGQKPASQEVYFKKDCTVLSPKCGNKWKWVLNRLLVLFVLFTGLRRFFHGFMSWSSLHSQDTLI